VLVLSRRLGESITIGHDITITVIEVRGDVIRLGIDAPRDIQVHRKEVYLELQEANLAAASPSVDAVEALAARLRDESGSAGDKPQEP